MGSKDFKFKKFSVAHNKCAQKVGTDGVLIALWSAKFKTASKVLDVGTGSGLIALILAQEFPDAKITGIEIENSCGKQAMENFAKSPFSSRLTGHIQSLQSFTSAERHDLIISNPPFFSDSQKAPNTQRNLARHTDSLPPQVFFKESVRLLNPNGRIDIIIPFNQYEQWKSAAFNQKLRPQKVTYIKDNANRPVKRVLVSFAFSGDALIEETLELHDIQRKLKEPFKTWMTPYYLFL